MACMLAVCIYILKLSMRACFAMILSQPIRARQIAVLCPEMSKPLTGRLHGGMDLIGFCDFHPGFPFRALVHNAHRGKAVSNSMITPNYVPHVT